MDRNQFPGLVLGSMKHLNMVIILYLAGVTAYSLNGYIYENSAMDFLIKQADIRSSVETSHAGSGAVCMSAPASFHSL